MNLLYNFKIESQNAPFGGIIKKIQNITNTEILKNTLIQLNTSSYDSEHPPEKIYGVHSLVNNPDYFRTLERKEFNQWFSIDFRSGQVQLDAIYVNLVDVDLFSSYTVYGTQNGYNEEEIGVINVDIPDELHTINFQKIFNIRSNKPYNIIRIRGNGYRCGYKEDTRLVFHNIDFFGTFYAFRIKTIQYKINYLPIIQHILIIFYLK